MKTSSRSILTGAALLLLAACQTTESDRELFVEADTNRDGQLSLGEVNHAFLPRLYNRFDLNHDGAVTLVEAREVEPGFDEKLFVERDLNKDGKVTYEEYSEVSVRKGGLKKEFAVVDTNGDNIIDKAEAEAYVARQEQKKSDQP